MISKIEKAMNRFSQELKGKLKAKSHFLALFNHFQKDPSSPLELFFYANIEQDAKALKQELLKTIPIVDISKSRDKWLVLGQVEDIDLNSAEFDQFITKMSEIAYINNCQFDGWGIGTILD